MESKKRNEFRRPQFGLRSLIVGGLVCGALAGTFGPAFAKSIRQWVTPAPAESLQPIVTCVLPPPDHDPAETGYYESAETPLR